MSVQPTRRLFTVDEYERMAEAGILGEDDRLELIEGEIVEMTPIGSRHSGTVNRLNSLFTSRLGQRAVVSVQNPVRLPPRSEPQPDLMLLRPRADFYSSAHPEPVDVLLLVEVAESSAGYDRGRKMPLYARHRVLEYWLLDVDAARIEVFRRPSEDGYRERRVVVRGERLTLEAFADLDLVADDLLPSG